MTSACAEQANSKMKKTGAEGAFNGPSLFPASDLERWTAMREAKYQKLTSYCRLRHTRRFLMIVWDFLQFRLVEKQFIFIQQYQNQILEPPSFFPMILGIM
jgi:hypothetical protein